MSGPLLALARLLLVANAELDEGRKLYDAMQFRAAESRLRIAREVAATAEEKREVLDLLARCLIVTDRAREAEEIYAELLASDPHVPEPVDVAPKITQTFLRAKQRLYPKSFVRLLVQGSDVTLVDPWRRVTQLALQRGADAPLLLELSPGKPIPLPTDAADAGTESSVSIEARDGSGAILASASAVPTAPAEPRVEAPLAAVKEPVVAVAAAVTETGPRWPKWVLGATGVLAGASAGVLFGLSTRDLAASQTAMWGGEQLQLAEQARNKVIAADVLAVVAALAVVVAVVLWIGE